MIDDLINQIEELVAKSTDKDPLLKLRIRVLAAGIKAANGMMKHPEIVDDCIDILTTTMELYGELVIFAQTGSKGISEDEQLIADALRNFQQTAKA